MKIAIGADHNGFAGKEYIKQHFLINDDPIEWIDVGTFDEERTDYPIFAQKVCNAMLEGQADKGILLCGTGIGMSIAANRFENIYAGLAWNEDVARLSREDDNTNILVLPSDYVSHELMVKMVHSWLAATFKGGRHQERIAMIDRLRR